MKNIISFALAAAAAVVVSFLFSELFPANGELVLGCGLFGFIGLKDKTPSPWLLRILAMENEVRGRQATGVYGNGLMKKAVAARQFIYDKNFTHVTKAQHVLGHTRWGTHGENTDQNAHPFIYRNEAEGYRVVGTHNGVISNYRDVAREQGLLVPTVDSEIIWQVLAKQWDLDTITLHRGQVALAFLREELDSEGNVTATKAYLHRRDNPLYIAHRAEGWYYSSLKESLEKANCKDIMELKAHQAFEFVDGAITNTFQIKEPARVDTSHWNTAGDMWAGHQGKATARPWAAGSSYSTSWDDFSEEEEEYLLLKAHATKPQAPAALPAATVKPAGSLQVVSVSEAAEEAACTLPEASLKPAAAKEVSRAAAVSCLVEWSEEFCDMTDVEGELLHLVKQMEKIQGTDPLHMECEIPDATKNKLKSALQVLKQAARLLGEATDHWVNDTHRELNGID
jgi:predicted glutamine amidotransferase